MLPLARIARLHTFWTDPPRLWRIRQKKVELSDFSSSVIVYLEYLSRGLIYHPLGSAFWMVIILWSIEMYSPFTNSDTTRLTISLDEPTISAISCWVNRRFTVNVPSAFCSECFSSSQTTRPYTFLNARLLILVAWSRIRRGKDVDNFQRHIRILFDELPKLVKAYFRHFGVFHRSHRRGCVADHQVKLLLQLFHPHQAKQLTFPCQIRRS